MTYTGTDGKLRDLKGVIFDMDGLMVDTEPLHYEAKKAICLKYGTEFTEEDNKKFGGMKDIEEARLIVTHFGLSVTPEEFTVQKQAVVAQLLQTGIQARPGLFEVLKFFKEQGMVMAIASNSTPSEIGTIVDALGVREYFSVLCSADEVTLGKPAPDLFLIAAQKLQLPPDNLLVLEDTPIGVKAAVAAGIPSFAVPSDMTKDAVFPELGLFQGKVDSLSEIPARINS